MSKDESRKESIRLFIWGILISVLGSFLVSACIESVNSITFVERTEWDILLIISAIFFFWSLVGVGRKLGFSRSELKAFKIVATSIVALVGLLWILEFYIVPSFFRSA